MADAQPEPDYTTLLAKLDLHAAAPVHLTEALTHRSYAEEHGGRHNDRLGWLGKAVINQTLTYYLYSTFLDDPEGKLGKRLDTLKSASSIATTARKLGLGELLRLGRGEAQTGGRDKDSNLAAAFRAVVGAVADDNQRYGMAAAQDLLLRTHQWAIDDVANLATAQDANTALETWAHRLELRLAYHTVAAGPDHAQRYYVTVVQALPGGETGLHNTPDLDSEPIAEGSGRTKRSAELVAAQRAIKKFQKAFHLQEPPARAKKQK